MITLDNDKLNFSFPDVHELAKTTISFSRTLRIPDNEEVHALPPGIGKFPVRHIDDLSGDLNPAAIKRGGIALPMHRSEAMWINFERGRSQEPAYPFAIKIAAGKINAVTGESWKQELSRIPQDYVVVPKQPWLDGFSVAKDVIAQFVAERLGEGYSVEEQITGKAEFGGIQIIAYPMKAAVYKERLLRPWMVRQRDQTLAVLDEKWRDLNERLLYLEELRQAAADTAEDPEDVSRFMSILKRIEEEARSPNLTGFERVVGVQETPVILSKNLGEPERLQGVVGDFASVSVSKASFDAAPEMGFAAGGKMRQQIYEDPYGIDAWDQERSSRCYVTLLDAESWLNACGEEAPTKAPTAEDYTNAGLPWFDYYEPSSTSLQGSQALSQVESWAQVKEGKGEHVPNNHMQKPARVVSLKGNDPSKSSVVREPDY